MTAVTIGIRYVSVSFNIYINNKIGAVAMGLFTLISSVYGFALTLATSGISLATTKLVSEALGGVEEERRASTVKAIMKIIFYKPWRFSRSLSSVAVHKRKSLKGRSNAKSIARFIAFTRSYRALLLNERIFYRYTKGSQKCVCSSIRPSDTNISLHLSA